MKREQNSAYASDALTFDKFWGYPKDTDEKTVTGPKYSRRKILGLFGAAGAGLLAAACTPGAKAIATATTPSKEIDLPYFSIKGAPTLITLPATDDRLANNGPDKDGNDHINPYMPKEAGFLAADPGHYRVDNITNVTDPIERASIEKDVKNGAAYAGNDYKKVLTAENVDEIFPLMESGGAAMFTTAQIELDLTDADGKAINIQCGRQPEHAWVIVAQNGLKRDKKRNTDVNRKVRAHHHDTAYTMWQATPPGSFVSAKFISQTVADAHNTYHDRGTSPGAGLDGVTNVSLLLVKILPEGVVYEVYRHDNLGEWKKYQPADFKPHAGNLKIS